MKEFELDKIVNICKQSGFIFPGSELYGGLANTWDYGPLGIELKNNLKRLWWKTFVQERINSYGVDAAILMNPKVWEASGHVSSFEDPLMDCKKCKMRYRADNLINEITKGAVNADQMTEAEMEQYIKENNVKCPNCQSSDFTNIRQFNLMFKTNRGVTEDKSNTIYLRPETAQGEYVNFLNIQRTMRAKIPFGIGQIGKVFRNEVTPGNFIFRTIEFEQMEYQFFCKKGTDENYYEEFKTIGLEFIKSLGVEATKLRFKDHDKLAHYAKAAVDIEYLFPFGWGEINGTHNRTDFDLNNHANYSKKNQEYLDPETNEKYIPYVIESTYGVDRIILCLLCDSYYEEQLENGEIREVMKFHPAIAPYKVAILPLIKKVHSEKALEIYQSLSKTFSVIYDEAGSIGKRYRRNDAIGTPYAITIDDETIKDGLITVRNRDTMLQEKINLQDLESYLSNKIIR